MYDTPENGDNRCRVHLQDDPQFHTILVRTHAHGFRVLSDDDDEEAAGDDEDEESRRIFDVLVDLRKKALAETSNAPN